MSESQAVTKFKAVQKQFEVRSADFSQMLPKHIPPHKFTRVALAAIQQNPKLLDVPQGALFRACMQCAQDGLLPDGREAALVPYSWQKKDGTWITSVSYQPMIAGIRKKAWNSGELASWEAYLVHDADEFEIVLGSDPRISHRPALKNRGSIIVVYSIAKFKNGASSMDWMGIDEVEAVRKRSRAASSGPWVTDYGEMVRKTMLRRHSKALPLSADFDTLLRREDELYEHQPALAPSISLNGAALADDGDEQPAIEKPKRGRPRLKDLSTNSSGDSREPPPHKDRSEDDAGIASPGPDTGGAPLTAAGVSFDEQENQAESDGYDSFFNGRALHPIPKSYLAYKKLSDAYIAGWKRAQMESADDPEQDDQ
jgi:recombination protein RecT